MRAGPTRAVTAVALPGRVRDGRGVPIAIPVALALLSLLTGPFTVAGFDVVAGQPAAAAVLAFAAVQTWWRRRIDIDVTSVLLVVPAAVAVAQRPSLGADAGGLGVFLPMAVAAAVLPTFVRRDRTSPVPPYLALGVILTVWMAAAVVPALLDVHEDFYGVKAAAELPIGGGNLIGAVLLVPIFLLLETDRAWWRTAGLAILLVGLALTLSRAAWLSGAVVLVVWWWRRRRPGAAGGAGRSRLLVGAAVAGMVAVIVVGAALLATGGRDRLEAIGAPAAGARATIWQAGVQAVAEDPVLGYGLYGFEEVAATVDRPENHPHNLVLAAVGMFGVAGGLAYLGWWGLALTAAFRDPRTDGVALALLAVFLHAQLDAWTFHLPFEMLAVTLVGMVRARGPDPAGGTRPHPSTR